MGKSSSSLTLVVPSLLSQTNTLETKSHIGTLLSNSGSGSVSIKDPPSAVEESLNFGYSWSVLSGTDSMLDTTSRSSYGLYKSTRRDKFSVLSNMKLQG